MMSLKALPAVFGVLALSLGGCSGTAAPAGNAAGGNGATGGGNASAGAGNTTAGSGSSTGGAGSNSCSATFDATTAHNYTFSSTITLTPVLVKPDSELTFDWSAVTKDFLGHDLNPAADVDSANLILWALNEQDLQTNLNADSLRQADIVVPAMAPTKKMATSVGLFDFQSAAGQPLLKEEILPYMNTTKYPPAANTYTFILATGNIVSGGRSRIIQAMKLDPASTNTMVKLSNDSTKLVYEANLHSLVPTSVPSGSTDLKISWADILKNAMGNPFLPTQITEVRVAHYTQTTAELEQKFLDLELIADGTWRNLEIAGTDVALSTLKNDAGQAFPGITASGTWVLGLVCGSCRNPAPWYLTILKPCQ